MTLSLTKVFELGNSAYFECYYRNMSSELTDPVNPTWTIFDMKASAVATGTPFKKSTGVYYFYWTSSTPADYTLLFAGVVLGQNVEMRRRFKVIRTSLKGEFSSSSSSSCSSSSCSSCSCSSCSCSSSFSSSCSCSSSFSSSSCSSCSCSSSSSEST